MSLNLIIQTVYINALSSNTELHQMMAAMLHINLVSALARCS